MNLAQLTAKAEGSLPDLFRKLGYEVDWDFSRRGGDRWYEILDKGRMVFQIDDWCTVEKFLADLPRLASADVYSTEEERDEAEWEIRCPNFADIQECFRRAQAGGLVVGEEQ
jgi:hypothetical protein